MNCLMPPDKHNLHARTNDLSNTLFGGPIRYGCAPSGCVRWPRRPPRVMSSSPVGRSTIISFIVSRAVAAARARARRRAAAAAAAAIADTCKTNQNSSHLQEKS